MHTLARPGDSLKGIAAMIFAAFLLTLNDALSKWLTETYSIWQVLALRHICSLLVIVPYIQFFAGWRTTRVTNRRGMALRSAFFALTTGIIVASFSVLPLALVTAIAFSSPIFVVAFSHLFTSEAVGMRRWLAVTAGFLGVLVIVRPGATGFEAVLLLPVLAAVTAACRDVVTRGLSRTDSSISILLWSNLAIIASGLVMTIADGWQGMSWPIAGLFLVNGILSACAHFLIIESLRLGEASLVAPFRYSGLIWATILGFAIWGDFPDGWTLAGAAVLVVSGVYIIERTPPPN